MLQNLAIVADDPVLPLPSTGAGTIAAARPGEADLSIGADRPSSIVAPEFCEHQYAGG